VSIQEEGRTFDIIIFNMLQYIMICYDMILDYDYDMNDGFGSSVDTDSSVLRENSSLF